MILQDLTKTQLINLILHYDTSLKVCIGKLYSKPKDQLIQMAKQKLKRQTQA